MDSTYLKDVIVKVGGVKKIADLCGITPRAVYKWIKAERLPRTDYTGETDYAGVLISEAQKRGVEISRDSLLKKAA